MKRVIRSSSILGMAFPMSVAKDKLTADAKQLNDHIMKCVIYGDSLSCLNHWIDDEITTWIYKASIISCKHRISSNVYKSTLFCWFGENSRDAESNLYDFYAKYIMRQKKYPKFEIDRYLIERLNKVYREIEKEIINMFCDKYNYSKKDYNEVLKEILE